MGFVLNRALKPPTFEMLGPEFECGVFRFTKH